MLFITHYANKYAFLLVTERQVFCPTFIKNACYILALVITKVEISSTVVS